MEIFSVIGDILTLGSKTCIDCLKLHTFSVIYSECISIVGSCCRNCHSITSFPLNTSIYIDQRTFESCTNLTTLLLNGQSISIKDLGFRHCENLVSFIINASKLMLGYFCFESYISLNSIVLCASDITIYNR